MDSFVKGGADQFVVCYLVSGICRGYSPDANLFLGSAKGATPGSPFDRQLQASSPCTCPVFNPPTGPPTEELFTFNYAMTVDDLRQMGELQRVTSLLRVAELEEVDCSGTFNSFSSVVVVDHVNLVSPIPDRDLIELQDAFDCL